MKIKVGCFNYDVVFTKETIYNKGEEMSGLIKYADLEILIDANMNKEACNQVVFHELVHALTQYFKIEFGEKEEQYVDLLATGIYALIKDNSEFIKSLLPKDKKNGA